MSWDFDTVSWGTSASQDNKLNLPVNAAPGLFLGKKKTVPSSKKQAECTGLYYCGACHSVAQHLQRHWVLQGCTQLVPGQKKDCAVQETS